MPSQTAPIDALLPKLKNVKPNSKGWMAHCPSHKDDKPSLSISVANDGTVLLKCFAGCDYKTILDTIDLKPKDLFPPKNSDFTIVKTYDYVDEKGTLIYQSCRLSGKRFSQRKPDGNGEWVWNLRGIKPVIYRLPQVLEAVKKGRSIFIVEGEKDVETLEKLGFVATTNSGGALKWKQGFTDWFQDAQVIVIPDYDDSGRQHAEDIASKLYSSAADIVIVHLPDIEEKEDITDWIKKGGTREQLIELINETPFWKPSDKPPVDPEEPVSLDVFDNAPFQCLGYNRGIYYYLPKEAQQVVPLSADHHSKSNLIALASIQWWGKNFQGTNGVAWDAAKNGLFRKAAHVGIYDSKRLRGCGAWFDNRRVVLHLGDRLLVDGDQTNVTAFDTRYIYEAATPTDITNKDPLTKHRAHLLLEVAEMFAWKTPPVSAKLFAGWCVVAPICGALYWRPHVWLTGSAGTGKTWVVDNVIRPILGNASLVVQSNTTEAGIRQRLGNNAFPVIFDEAEGSDKYARQRIQSVLELMRQASSETEGEILKGFAGRSGCFVPDTVLFLSCIDRCRYESACRRIKDDRIDS